MIGKMYQARKNSIGAPEGNNNAEKQLDQNDRIVSRREIKDGTAGQIAKELGIDGKTVRRNVRRVQQFSGLHLALWRSELRFFLLLNRHFDDSAHCTDLLPYHREFVFSLHTVSQADMFSAHEIDFCDRAVSCTSNQNRPGSREKGRTIVFRDTVSIVDSIRKDLQRATQGAQEVFLFGW